MSDFSLLESYTPQNIEAAILQMNSSLDIYKFASIINSLFTKYRKIRKNHKIRKFRKKPKKT